MDKKRRKYKLADKTHKDIDLRQYEQLIVDTVNQVIQNKNPRVYKEYFSTYPLSQSEAVLLGKALAKIDKLKIYGKTVTTFRLFDGKIYNNEQSNKPINKKE